MINRHGELLDLADCDQRSTFKICVCMQVPIQVKVIWFLLHSMTTLVNINTWITRYREIWGYTPCIWWHYNQPQRLWDDSCKKNSTDPGKEEKDDDYQYYTIIIIIIIIIINILIIIISYTYYHYYHYYHYCDLESFAPLWHCDISWTSHGNLSYRLFSIWVVCVLNPYIKTKNTIFLHQKT